MSKVLKHAVIYTGEEKITDGYLRFTDRIENVGPMSEFAPQAGDSEIIDLAGKIVVPGFIDVHSHGGYSFDAMDGNADQLNEMVNDMVYEGVTSYFATTMTQSNENIDQAMVAVNEAMQKNPVILGAHLEGPFVALDFKGAQPPEYIKDPDAKLLAHWNELAGGNIKMITYA